MRICGKETSRITAVILKVVTFTSLLVGTAVALKIQLSQQRASKCVNHVLINGSVIQN